jgi:hypothetical protein
LGEAGETETTQQDIQDWLELDKGDPGFQLLKEEEIAALEKEPDNGINYKHLFHFFDF